MSTKVHSRAMSVRTIKGQATSCSGRASRCHYGCFSVFARDRAAVASYASPGENDRCQAVLSGEPFEMFSYGSVSGSRVISAHLRRAVKVAGPALHPVRYPLDETDLVSIPRVIDQ